MNLIEALQSLKAQVKWLQDNQKPAEQPARIAMSSGLAYEPPSPCQQIDQAIMEVGKLYEKLSKAQEKIINYNEDY